MSENITRADADEVIKFLQQDPLPQLTNGPKVQEFEKAWSKWLGVRYSLFVNSGSSANELTLLALREIFGGGEVIVPPLTWVSDIASVLHVGMTPVFCDINLKNLSFDHSHLLSLITDQTRAIFLTHVLGINGLTQELLDLCKDKNILLLEDVCESHGVTFKGQKVGTFGFASNFSFYFAHHMSTIEGGMVCTNNEGFYEILRCLRSHGMLREATAPALKETVMAHYPDLNKDFIFIAPSHNFRSTEINAVIGLSQLKRLDTNNARRSSNFAYFIQRLDPNKYYTDFEMEGQVNYAFTVILRKPDIELRNRIEKLLEMCAIEFRRGLSGGGSQAKQPYVRERYTVPSATLPTMEHVHHFSWYIGNFPDLPTHKIDGLLKVLNNAI